MFRHGWRVVLAVIGALVPGLMLAPAAVRQVAAEESLPAHGSPSRVSLSYGIDQAVYGQSRLNRLLARLHAVPAARPDAAHAVLRAPGRGLVGQSAGRAEPAAFSVPAGQVLAAPARGPVMVLGEGPATAFPLDGRRGPALMLRAGMPALLAFEDRRPAEACKDIETTGPPLRS